MTNFETQSFPITDSAFEPFRVALFRQRRLLLWLSLFLAAYHGAGVTPGHQAESQGVKLEIGDPIVLVVGAWLGWLWAFWRYWQYEHSFRDVAYDKGIEFETQRGASEAAERRLRQQVSEGKFVDRGISSEAELLIDSSVSPQFSPTVGGAVMVSDLRVSAWDRTRHTALSTTIPVSLSTLEYASVRKEARQRFHLSRPYTADYKAPYVLALLAPFAVAVRWLFLR